MFEVMKKNVNIMRKEIEDIKQTQVHFKMHISQIIMLYTLNVYSDVH